MKKGFKIYQGNGKTHEVIVKVHESMFVVSNEYKLPLEERISHGFQWGYGGSGPASLAYQILKDLYNEVSNYQDFKWLFIANIPMNQNFSLYSERIDIWKYNQNRCIKCLKKDENVYNEFGENTFICGSCD